MIDPTHPLFGRRFLVESRTSSLSSPGYVLVVYRELLRLRIPVTATSLIPSLPVTRTKLTRAPITDLVALAVQYEVLCLSSPPTSGVASRPHSRQKSSKNSSRSFRR